MLFCVLNWQFFQLVTIKKLSFCTLLCTKHYNQGKKKSFFFNVILCNKVVINSCQFNQFLTILLATSRMIFCYSGFKSLCAEYPNPTPTIDHRIACMLKLAKRKCHKTSAEKLAGTSLTGGIIIKTIPIKTR